MLTIKEIFDICKEHDVFVDLSYLNSCYDPDRHYMIKLYYGRKRHYRLVNSDELEIIFANYKNFDRCICDFVEKMKEKDNKKYKLTRYVHEWDDPVEIGEFDSINEAKKAGEADMEKVFCGRYFTTMKDWKKTSYGFKNEALHGDDDYIYVISEKEAKNDIRDPGSCTFAW